MAKDSAVQMEIPGTPVPDMRPVYETELNATIARISELEKELRAAKVQERTVRAALGRLG